MTTHAMAGTPAATVSRRPSDLRHATRVLAAVLLPLGPAAVAVLRFVMPYNTTDDATKIAQQVAAHQGRQNMVVWLGFIAVLTLIPAVLFVGRLIRPHAPRLTAIAVSLAALGYIGLAYLVASDAAVLFAVRHHVDLVTAGKLYAGSHPIVVIAEILFVLGHVLGTILLGVALWRTRVVPRWAAAATIVAQPLHFVVAVIVTNHPVDLVAWGLNAVGFAAVAVAILRLRDDEWDLAPARSR